MMMTLTTSAPPIIRPLIYWMMALGTRGWFHSLFSFMVWFRGTLLMVTDSEICRSIASFLKLLMTSYWNSFLSPACFLKQWFHKHDSSLSSSKFLLCSRHLSYPLLLDSPWYLSPQSMQVILYRTLFLSHLPFPPVSQIGQSYRRHRLLFNDRPAVSTTRILNSKRFTSSCKTVFSSESPPQKSRNRSLPSCTTLLSSPPSFCLVPLYSMPLVCTAVALYSVRRPRSFCTPSQLNRPPRIWTCGCTRNTAFF